MLRKAGFVDIVATASCESYGNPETTRLFGKTAAGFIDSYANTAIQMGWADKEQNEQMKQEVYKLKRWRR